MIASSLTAAVTLGLREHRPFSANIGVQPARSSVRRAGVGAAIALALLIVGVLLCAFTTPALPPAVATGFDRTLGRAILTDAQGAPLYTQTNASTAAAIVHGRLCPSAWSMLTVASGTPLPARIPGLTLDPPAFGRQLVRFHGQPLFRHLGDRHDGQAHGDHLRSTGGTWLAVETPKPTNATPALRVR